MPKKPKRKQAKTISERDPSRPAGDGQSDSVQGSRSNGKSNGKNKSVSQSFAKSTESKARGKKRDTQSVPSETGVPEVSQKKSKKTPTPESREREKKAKPSHSPSTSQAKEPPEEPTVKNGPPSGGGIPSSRAEIAMRIRIIEALMLKGYLGRDIQRTLERQFRKKLTWFTVSKYIRHVAKMWEEEDALMRPYRRARQLRQLHDVADTMLSKEMFREWLDCQRLIARVEGNEAPQQIQVNDQRSRFEGWTVKELENYAETEEVPPRFVGDAKGEIISKLPAAGKREDGSRTN